MNEGRKRKIDRLIAILPMNENREGMELGSQMGKIIRYWAVDLFIFIEILNKYSPYFLYRTPPIFMELLNTTPIKNKNVTH